MTKTIKILKWALIVLNVAFFSAGYHIIYENYNVDQRVYHRSEREQVLHLPILLTYVLGSLIIVTSLFGILAAFQQNSLQLKFYALLVFTLLVSQIYTHYLFYQATPQIRKQIVKEILFNEYQFKTNEEQNKIQEIQQAHACCGVYGPGDYNRTLTKLPNSCCGKYRAEEIDGHGKCSEDEVRNVNGCGTWLYPALSHPVDELFSFRCLYIMFVASYLCQLPSFVLAFVLNRKILTQFKV